MTSEERIYDLWVKSSPRRQKARDFHIALARRAGGPVGVFEAEGHGLLSQMKRLGIKAAALGPGARRAEDGDMPCFNGPEAGRPFGEGKFALVVVPFPDVARIWRMEERERFYDALWKCIAPGGLLALDVGVRLADRDPADGAQRLVAERRFSDGSSGMVWETLRDSAFSRDVVEVSLGMEVLSQDGIVLEKSYRKLLLAKLDGDEAVREVLSAGFELQEDSEAPRREEDGPEPPVKCLLFRKAERG